MIRHSRELRETAMKRRELEGVPAATRVQPDSPSPDGSAPQRPRIEVGHSRIPLDRIAAPTASSRNDRAERGPQKDADRLTERRNESGRPGSSTFETPGTTLPGARFERSGERTGAHELSPELRFKSTRPGPRDQGTARTPTTELPGARTRQERSNDAIGARLPEWEERLKSWRANSQNRDDRSTTFSNSRTDGRGPADRNQEAPAESRFKSNRPETPQREGRSLPSPGTGFERTPGTRSTPRSGAEAHPHPGARESATRSFSPSPSAASPRSERPAQTERSAPTARSPSVTSRATNQGNSARTESRSTPSFRRPESGSSGRGGSGAGGGGGGGGGGGRQRGKGK
jgi:hypothetical protein